MNIFALSEDPRQAAEWHNDRHVVKMLIEYAQQLSVAHRMLDGTHALGHRGQEMMLLPGEELVLSEKQTEVKNQKCCLLTHPNHPNCLWVRENVVNYMWLVTLLEFLHREWNFRYRHDKRHKTFRYFKFLSTPPKNIKPSANLTPFPKSMEKEYQIYDDPVLCYRHLYQTGKHHLAFFKRRGKPEWFTADLPVKKSGKKKDEENNDDDTN